MGDNLVRADFEAGFGLGKIGVGNRGCKAFWLEFELEL